MWNKKIITFFGNFQPPRTTPLNMLGNRRKNLFVRVYSFVNFQSTQGLLAVIITIIESLFTINFLKNIYTVEKGIKRK